MHSCKFYSFLRDQSLEKWVKYIKISIINKRFYLLTEIFRQPAKIEKFNRLPTKIENFNRLPTKLLNFNRQPTSGSPHSDPLLMLGRYFSRRINACHWTSEMVWLMDHRKYWAIEKLAMLFSKRTPEASSTVLASTAGYYSTQIGGLALVTMTVSQEGVRASYLGEASVAQCCVQKSRTVRDSNPWYWVYHASHWSRE